MSHSAIYELTAKRLTAYKLFDASIVKEVARLAENQSQFDTYQSFFASVNVPREPTLFVTGSGRGVPLIDIDARDAHEKGVLVVHLPMGNSLDSNQLYQVATLAYAFPAYRIIAFGNPSGKPYAYKQENLSFVDWFRVSFTNNLRVVVSAEIEYLASQNIQNAHHIGYSFGALKALLAAYYSEPARISRLIILDPVSHPRRPRQLLKDFTSTLQPLGEYVNRTKMKTFLDAREDTSRIVRYNQGLRRPVNIAAGFMLARVDFISWLSDTLQKNDGLRAFIAWGGKSELGNDDHMKGSLHTLANETAPGRLKSLRLEHDAHAFANDIFLQVAIVKRALLG